MPRFVGVWVREKERERACLGVILDFFACVRLFLCLCACEHHGACVCICVRVSVSACARICL